MDKQQVSKKENVLEKKNSLNNHGESWGHKAKNIMEEIWDSIKWSNSCAFEREERVLQKKKIKQKYSPGQ